MCNGWKGNCCFRNGYNWQLIEVGRINQMNTQWPLQLHAIIVWNLWCVRILFTTQWSRQAQWFFVIISLLANNMSVVLLFAAPDFVVFVNTSVERLIWSKNFNSDTRILEEYNILSIFLFINKSINYSLFLYIRLDLNKKLYSCYSRDIEAKKFWNFLD